MQGRIHRGERLHRVDARILRQTLIGMADEPGGDEQGEQRRVDRARGYRRRTDVQAGPTLTQAPGLRKPPRG